MDKIKRYVDLAEIFSEDGSRALGQIFQLDYYDPDTAYKEDVQAYVSALREKCAELRKIDSAGEARRS